MVVEILYVKSRNNDKIILSTPRKNITDWIDSSLLKLVLFKIRK